MTTNDADRDNALADWAQSDDRDIDPTLGEGDDQSRADARELLRRAGGRPAVDPAAAPGEHSPRRQVRLPKHLSERLDALAEHDHRSPSDLMREAIAHYINDRDHQHTA